MDGLEGKSRHLEKKLDVDILEWNLSRKEDAADAHIVKFDGTKQGTSELAQVLFLVEHGETTRLFEDFFRRAEFVLQFLKVSKKDIDRLLDMTHDGRSCRYYRDDDPSPRSPLDPEYPWYLQNGNVSVSVDRSDRVHEEECLYCVLDRKCLQMERDITQLLILENKWVTVTKNSQTAMEIQQRKRAAAPSPSVVSTPHPRWKDRDEAEEEMLPTGLGEALIVEAQMRLQD